MEIVECMMEQVKIMEDNLLKLKKDDVRVSVHRLELQRIKFMVNSYLRIRLEKIQNNIFYYSSHTPDSPSRKKNLREISDRIYWNILIRWP